MQRTISTPFIQLSAERVLLFFLLLAVLIRLFSFFPSVINHDESTYIIIGRELLRGQLYYVDLFDTKPVGIFLLYALFSIIAFGKIWVYRLFAALAVGLSAYLIYLISKKLTAHETVALTAGFSYVVATSVFVYYGVSPNAELFFVPMVLASLWIVLRKNVQSWWVYGWSGVWLGMAFMVKFVVVADVMAQGLFLLLWVAHPSLEHRLQSVVAQAVGFFLPGLAVAGYYGLIGHLDAFLYYTFEVSSSYAVSASPTEQLLYFGDFFWRIAWIVIPFVLPLFHRQMRQQRVYYFWYLYTALVIAVILYLGKAFGHYQLQLLPPMILGAVAYYDRLGWLRRLRLKKLMWGMVAVSVVISLMHFIYYRNRPDLPREVASYIDREYPGAETIYFGDFHHITYLLTDKSPPNGYVHRALMYTDSHIRTLDIDLVEEAHKLLAQRPDLIFMRTAHTQNTFTKLIRKQYYPIDTLQNELLVLVPVE